MIQARIGSGHEFLRLTADVAENGPPESLLAELRLHGLSASVQVVHHYATGFADLAEFFQRHVDDWRGWDGVRTWESLERDLRIDASHQYGHVQLRVTIQRFQPGWGNEGWTATGDLTIEPGEQLSQIAQEVKALATGS
ncbi:DUF6228 family protein [Amycolatopsis keratiniphila]|uniref:DUF6228 family protein n=1 Tax=Amycolatopsis keratiniphila TaxID=129921 RepID=UPI00087A4941|nr:DUF6228 family protein [Amycolatopsis keratiniphila]OLZ58064.1 hypothetical protein BS330_12555 [Amycolatopsis keratiniphila subsp. nogabecina]SDU43758.1 hypothetical protein SAMN04489733_4247 [Amycolatopsis keratiniphila]